jgi:hypothetical protein
MPADSRRTDDASKAEVLAGRVRLAGRIGSADQTEGGQEAAKNLITQSMELFEGLEQGAIEAQESSAFVTGVKEPRRSDTSENAEASWPTSLICAPCCSSAPVSLGLGTTPNEAMRFYNEAAPLVERSQIMA